MQQGVVLSLNLSLVLAFVPVSIYLLEPLWYNQRQVVYLQVGSPLALTANTPCEFPYQNGKPGNFTANCHEHISLPLYTSSCLNAWSQDTPNQYACEFVPADLHKFVPADLPQTAPRVHSFVKAMAISADDAVRQQCEWSAPE